MKESEAKDIEDNKSVMSETSKAETTLTGKADDYEGQRAIKQYPYKYIDIEILREDILYLDDYVNINEDHDFDERER